MTGKGTQLSQFIKVIDIVEPANAERFATRLCEQTAAKTEAVLNLCKERLIQEQLIVPKSVNITDIAGLRVRPSSEKVEAATNEEGSEFSSSVEKTYTLSSHVATLLLTSREDDVVQLRHEVSADEQELVTSPGPHFVLGRSGTGKTTVMLHRMLYFESEFKRRVEARTIEPDNFKQLLVTASPILATAIQESYRKLSETGTEKILLKATNADEADRRKVKALDSLGQSDFPLITTFDALLTMIDLCLLDGSPPFLLHHKRRVDLPIFQARYFSKMKDVSSGGRFKIDASVLYREISSVIKGSMSAAEEGGCMSLETYVALSENRSSAGLNADERRHYYSLFEAYQDLKSREIEDYDIADFVYHVYSHLLSKNPLKLRFQNVYVDEVQDLTMLQVAILRFVCDDWKGFFFAGDTAQTIAQGVGFRFESLKDLFYKEILPTFKPEDNMKVPEVKQLRQNFRTHYHVLRLANTVIRLLLCFFPDSMDKVEEEQSLLQNGPKPIFLEDTEDVMSKLFEKGEMQNCEFGSEQVILVRDALNKKSVQERCGSNALVLTVYECKGMEFSDVLIYNFFSSTGLENKWRVVYSIFKSEFQIDGDYKFPKFDPKEHFALCQELKMLYVLITRAKQRVFFFEQDKKVREVMTDLWSKLKVVKIQTFNDEIKQILTVKSTPDEWCDRGHEFLQRQNYEDARLCFQRGGDHYHERFCYAKLLEYKALEEEASDRLKSLRLYRETAEIFEKEPLNMLKEAADLYKKGDSLQKAAELYAQVRRWTEAATCFVEIKQWKPAAENFLLDGKVDKALDCYYEIPDYNLALKVLDQEVKTSDGNINANESVADLQNLRNACIKKGANYHFAKNEEQEMIVFVSLFPNMEEIRLFLKRRQQHNVLIKFEIKAGNFDLVGRLYQEQGNYQVAADTYKKGKLFIKQVQNELKTFRMKHINENLLPEPLNKSGKEFLTQSLKVEGVKGSVLEIEIKFWLNEFEKLSFSSFPVWVEKVKNYPNNLNIRLPWLLFRKLLSTGNSTADNVSWGLLSDVIESFRDLVCSKTLTVMKKRTSLVPSELLPVESEWYCQILDLFGLR
jgi:tetratricopeptide (TPR) repeat protein/phosphotransferase system HPr-like phosphotransfer protein